MDNHHPKGPHIHVNDKEFDYEYINDKTPHRRLSKLGT